MINTLKLGTTKQDYPVYGQYLHSTGKQVQTYNKEVLVCIDHELPFKGSTNFFVLENYLKNDYELEQDNDIINVKFENFKSKLVIDYVGFPVINPPVYKNGLIITEELLYMLKYALNFTGNDCYKYVIVTNKGIIATNKQKLIYFNKPLDIKSNIYVDKRIVNVLKEGYEINADENTFVKFEGGYMIFEIDDISELNINKIFTRILEYANNVTLLCNAAYFQDAIQKVSSVLFLETKKCIDIFNKKMNLMILAESCNGESSIEYKSGIKKRYESKFNINNFTNISLDYNVYVNLENQNYLYLKNENSEIVIIKED